MNLVTETFLSITDHRSPITDYELQGKIVERKPHASPPLLA